MNMLVTGSGGPAGLNVLKFLPPIERLVACDASEESQTKIGKIGRNGVKFYKVPLGSDPLFLDSIRDIVTREGITQIIPTVDEELLVFSRQLEQVNTMVIVSPYETIETCNDKLLLYRKFQKFDICPRYIVTQNKNEIQRLFIDEKVFVKPRISRGSRGTYLFNNPSQVPDELVNCENIFCEYLPGKEYTIDVLCDFDGKLVIAIPRLRIEKDRGICIRGRTENRPEIIKKAEEICNNLIFIGPINIQLKYDLEGKPKLVEINPRMSGGFPITVASGVNSLELLYKLLMGEHIEYQNLNWKETESIYERL